MRYSESSRKKRGKRRKKHYFLNICICILVIAGLWFLAFRSGVFDIHKINVTNNAYYTSARVAELSGVKLGDNIFKTRTFEVEKTLKKDPYIREAHVEWVLPDELAVELEERAESVAIAYADGYAILDFDGVILRLSEALPAIPVIRGLTPQTRAPGLALKVAETGQLGPGLDFIEFIGKNDFYVAKLELGGVVPRAYVFEHLAIEGDLKNIQKNLDSVKRVIADLDAKGVVRGTISVGNSNCSFSPELR